MVASRKATNPFATLVAEARGSTRQRVVTIALLLIGMGLWLALEFKQRTFGPGRWGVLLTAVGLSLLPPVGRAVSNILERIRHPSPRAATRAAVAVGLAAAGYFVLSAVLQDRDLFPKTHDDQSYFLQMQMLARGRLWMPAHPLADFFDTFYVLVRPKYASMYFPGAALLYVPTIWLHLPPWAMPAAVAGMIVALVYRLVTETADGVAGALAALVVVSLSWFRMYSVLLTSHEPVLLLGLVLLEAWLRWRAAPAGRGAWLAAVGAAAGWAAITRPVDAICFALPIGVALLFDLRGKPARTWAAAGGLILAGAGPFLLLQGIANRGITGHWLTTPFRLYLDQSQPGTAFGFRAFDPNLRPASTLPQKQDYYDAFYVPFIRDHQAGRLAATWGRKYLPEIAATTLPAPVLALLLPAGMAGIRAVRRRAGAWVLIAVLPGFVLLYLGYTIFLEHYALLVAPSVALLVVLGGRAVEAAWPRRRERLSAALAVGVAVACLTTLPELNPLWGNGYATDDETFHLPEKLRLLRQVEPTLAPAVILFHYTRPPANEMLWINTEPVYNTAAAWPDDAPVVRAHDLGPGRNGEIVRYYAERQPDRHFYRWDVLTGAITDLGTARDLAARGGG